MAIIAIIAALAEKLATVAGAADRWRAAASIRHSTGLPATSARVIWAFVPCSLLIACSLLGACSLAGPKFSRPNVSVVSIDMRGGNLLQQNFAVKLNIQNPNSRTLPVNGVHVELNVGGEQIASGVSDRAFVVPAAGEQEFDMTIKANVALALLKFASKMDQHADTIDYELTGAASIDLPFLRDLPFHQSGSFPLQGLR